MAAFPAVSCNGLGAHGKNLETLGRHADGKTAEAVSAMAGFRTARFGF